MNVGDMLSSARVMNAFQISAGSGAARDGPAVELRLHRPELVRVADPHRHRELGRVPDEPGVAVVVVRARLPGRLAAGELRALARALLDDPSRIVVIVSACAGREDPCRATGSLSATLPLLRKNLPCAPRAAGLLVIEPSTRLPSFAMVAYARAMSSGLTATKPRPIEK